MALATLHWAAILVLAGNNVCPQHLDLVYEKPTIYLDESLFMKDGVLTEL